MSYFSLKQGEIFHEVKLMKNMSFQRIPTASNLTDQRRYARQRGNAKKLNFPKFL
jgi:hypothetical protein